MGITFDEYLEENAFPNISVVGMYSVVEDARRALGFHTPGDDNEIMRQAEYVTKQYRKFVETLRPAILEAAKEYGPESLYWDLVQKKQNLDDYPKDVNSALYCCVRDTWLTQVLNTISYWVANPEEFMDEEEELNG